MCILSDTITVISPTVLCKMFVVVVLRFSDKTAIVAFCNHKNSLQLHYHAMTADQWKLNVEGNEVTNWIKDKEVLDFNCVYEKRWIGFEVNGLKHATVGCTAPSQQALAHTVCFVTSEWGLGICFENLYQTWPKCSGKVRSLSAESLLFRKRKRDALISKAQKKTQ